MIKAVIFDLDGVLIDAAEWHFEALNKALGLFGYTISHEDHLARFNGLPTTKKLELLDVPASLKPFIAEMKKKYTEQTIREKCRPDYQKIILLRELSQKYRLACASNAIIASVEQMLEFAEIKDYFALILGNDSVAVPKPDPLIYIETMKALHLLPSECVIVEDAPPGIAAAKASGARVIEVVGYRDVHCGRFIEERLL